MKIVSALKKNRKKLMRLPSVASVGVGQKNGKDVILVFVTRAAPEAAARDADEIPHILDGYEVDVREEIRVG
jgi:hypothetical protein